MLAYPLKNVTKNGIKVATKIDCQSYYSSGIYGYVASFNGYSSSISNNCQLEVINSKLNWTRYFLWLFRKSSNFLLKKVNIQSDGSVKGNTQIQYIYFVRGVN